MSNTKIRFIATAALFAVACGGSKGSTTATPVPPSGEKATASGEATVKSFRDAQPPAAAPRPFRLPAIQQFKLASGAEAYLVENHDLPTISATVTWNGGSLVDPKGKEGMSSMCMDMLGEGTRKLDKIAYKRALADIGSDITPWQGVDTQGVTVRTLTKNLDPTLELFRDTLTTPGFRNADLGRMAARRIEGIKQAKASPSSIAGRVRASLTYGINHPFGRVSTESSIRRIKINDCRRFAKQTLSAKTARLFIVGDMTEEQVRAAFEPVLSKLRGKGVEAKVPAREPRDGRIFFVDVPGAEQSSVFITHPGPQRQDPSYFSQWMAASIFGGGFAGRINMNLREDKGYAYGAYGSFSYGRETSTFYAGASVRSDSTVQSIRELMGELKAFVGGEKPAMAEELSREKNGAILALPARFATSRGSLGNFRELVYYGLPLTYYNDFVGSLSKVDLESVNTAARSTLKPDEVRLLVVGDGSALMKVRDDSGADKPMVDRDGNAISLRMALEMMAATKELGDGGLVFIDADGKPASKKKTKRTKK